MMLTLHNSSLLRNSKPWICSISVGVFLDRFFLPLLKIILA